MIAGKIWNLEFEEKLPILGDLFYLKKPKLIISYGNVYIKGNATTTDIEIYLDLIFQDKNALENFWQLHGGKLENFSSQKPDFVEFYLKNLTDLNPEILEDTKFIVKNNELEIEIPILARLSYDGVFKKWDIEKVVAIGRRIENHILSLVNK
jgi:hypothetical protein